ncbi:podoplanin isoform X2 [Etheostoma spectabile]|uniref:podoplanin isoform X2 n=1 Tax=Etheostoma spectabile TaxID=54343 RepID=UPI0013AEEF9F|nr:podoplanin isoform X2 [Etheostoma spectabile]
MNVQLLLLLALVGPFCALTHASPTGIPPQPDETTKTVTDIPEASDSPKEELTVITGPPATEPAAAPEEVATEVVTKAAPTAFTVNTDVVETDAPAAATTVAAPEPLITDAPVVETEATTEPADVEDQPEVTEAAQTVGGVVIENDTEEGLSSGQVVGIVIGALLAVVVLIAVVIAVVRRMGKYSSAKSKKPAKKDSVMVSPLRKKSAKQQERSKFWKF